MKARRWVLAAGAAVFLARCAAGAGSLCRNETTDLDARTAYLVSAIRDPGFPERPVPGFEGSIIESEWRLVTISMTAASIAARALAQPSSEAAHTTAALVDVALDPRIREFDTAGWDEDALEALDGSNGHAGYLGHLGVVLGAARLAGDRRHVELHDRVTAAIARRVRDADVEWVETYPDRRWSADHSVLIAALGMHDRATGAHAFDDVLVQYAENADRMRGSDGLVAFTSDGGGFERTFGRGSGSTWCVYWLAWASRDLALEEWRAVERNLVQWRFGVFAGVREATRDMHGDADSGPLILGISPAATGFGIAGARLSGNEELERGLLRTAELAGVSYSDAEGTTYLLGPLVGDASVLAMRTVPRS